MAVTATVSITASVATVSALAGGTLQQFMTMTYGAQTQPVTPAVYLGSQLTGTPGSNGTYNVNNLASLASTTVTFELVEAAGGLPAIATPGQITVVGAPVTPTTPIKTIPPPPLPSTAGSNIGVAI